MKVKELLELLSQVNPELEVVYTDWTCWTDAVTRVETGNYNNLESTFRPLKEGSPNAVCLL